MLTKLQTPIRILFKLFLSLILLTLIGSGVLYYLIKGVHIERETALGSKKMNALYLAHTWVDNYHSRDEIHTLISKLIDNNIRIAFLHSGPFESDGTIPNARLKFAKSFLLTAKQLAPDIEFVAWLGQKREDLPIEQATVRSMIGSETKRLVTDYGFQGIHLNIEPMQSDPFFVETLKEVRKSLDSVSSTLHLSAAITPIVPRLYSNALRKYLNASHLLGYSLYGNYNDTSHIKELSKIVDYIVLMGYDTGLKKTTTYQFFLEQELIYLLKSAPEKAIVALPSYEDSRPNFHADVENISNALDGIAQGLTNIRVTPGNLAGLAIYSDWTTDAVEWKVWKNKWLRPL